MTSVPERRIATRVAIGARPDEAGPRATTAVPHPVVPMPTTGPLVDTFGRRHDDLRLSVTDRCNLRCVYCMPEEGVTFVPRREILTFEELVRLATVARDLGVVSLRLTGGEPLVRKGIVDLVGRLGSLGFADLSMTTNGMLLAPVAARLAEAGLTRVNISCDSLRPGRFAELRRRGDLGRVLEAMEAAEAAGLRPLKVNVVLMAGVNDDEIVDFGEFARSTGRTVRFIEFMPLDGDGQWGRDRLVPGRRVLDVIRAAWPIEPVRAGTADPAPAERFRFVDGNGEIGVISSVTQPFCGACNRLRLTADGAVRNCLFSDDERSLRDLMRDGGSDEDIALVLRRAVWAKASGHGINDPAFVAPRRSMSMIGG